MNDVWSSGQGTPWARLRRDETTVSRLLAAVTEDPRIMRHIRYLDTRPHGTGTAGLLFPCRLSTTHEAAMLKLNVGTLERHWLLAMQTEPGLVPTVFEAGEWIGDLHLGWAIIEHLAHAPNGAMGRPEWHAAILDASTRWHVAGLRKDPPTLQTIDEAWIRRWLQTAVEAGAPDSVRALAQRLPTDWEFVRTHADLVPSHGDLHFKNSGSRTGQPGDGLALFDPMPRTAPWPFDAAYCETLTFSEPRGDSLVANAAELRRSRGLPTPEDAKVERLSVLFCGWLSVMWYVNFGGDWSNIDPHHRLMTDLDRALAV